MLLMVLKSGQVRTLLTMSLLLLILLAIQELVRQKTKKLKDMEFEMSEIQKGINLEIQPTKLGEDRKEGKQVTRERAAISRSPLRRMRWKAGTFKTQEPRCEEIEDRVRCNRIATARCVNCTKHLCPGHTYRLHRHVVVYHQARVVAERAQQQEWCRPCLENNNLLHLQPHPAHGFNGIGFNMRNKDEIVEILNPQTLVDVGNIGHLDNEIDMAGLD